MPELPEVEIAARLLDAELAGAEIESAFAPGLNAVKTFDPPLDSLAGSRLRRIGRRGKLFVLEFEGAASWVGLIHLMSAGRLREMTVATLGEAIDHYERELSLPLPDKLPMPLQVHRRQGEPCPRCGAELAAVHFEDYVIAYCPAEQTGGRLLKDRRMSRLLR